MKKEPKFNISKDGDKRLYISYKNLKTGKKTKISRGMIKDMTYEDLYAQMEEIRNRLIDEWHEVNNKTRDFSCQVSLDTFD